MPNDDLKWAVVTGASKGIGREIARMLAGKGFGIIALARSQRRLRLLSEEIREQGGKAHYLAMDLSKPEEITGSQAFFASFSGKIELLIHNAGIVQTGKITEMDPAGWQQVLDVNLRAPFLLTQLVTPLLAPRSQIIFINSVAGIQTFPEWGAYSASKFGLKALADTLRAELEPEGIRVTSIFPSSVNTSMQDDVPYDWDRSRMLQPAEVARAVCYCADQPPHTRINELHLENSSGTF